MGKIHELGKQSAKLECRVPLGPCSKNFSGRQSDKKLAKIAGGESFLVRVLGIEG